MNSLLVLVLVLGAFLRFYQPGASGIGNVQYAAAVKSMLQSWHNFFFLAFEPGGSLSVDTTNLPRALPLVGEFSVPEHKPLKLGPL
ncbi:MAG TPA: hypothetical protein VII93_14300 [Anaerolineales bacterium]